MSFKIPLDPDHDYLSKYKDLLNVEGINAAREERNKCFSWKGTQLYYPILENSADITASFTDFSGIAPVIGKREELTDDQYRRFHDGLKQLMPWRKGPFTPFGVELDAEWRSDWKWQRVTDFLEKSGISLERKRIADIGCNNGYYMFRMLKDNPELIIGFDPTIRYFFQFHYLNRMIPNSPLHYEITGVEQIPLYPKFFDMIFCMGILYHNQNPVGILKDMHSALAKDGTIIIETQGIPGDMPVALFPDKRYAQIPGTYFVPTVPCLINWLQKAQFKDIEVFYTHKLEFEEQRRTEWMDWQSLEDFLDPEDPAKTIEGYPAPIRIYVKAVKK